jgi:tetratricopeptide (TPR) repeat protein
LEKPVSSIQVPPTVQAVLAARIDRLSAEQKRVVQTAAVIGTEVPAPLLQAVVDLPEDTLHRGLTHLQAAEFLYETRLFPEREYTFKHALTQQVAYQSLLSARRQQIHGRIAHALTEHFTELAEGRPELVAHHYAEAGLAERAVASWSRAGHRASERSAYVEAISHLRSGLDALRTLPENAARAEQELSLQLALAASLQATLGYTAPEVLQAYNRAHALSQQIDNTPQHFPVLAGLRRFYTFRGDLQTALRVAEQLFALVQRQEDPALLREAHWALGQTMFFQGEFVSARAHLQQSIIRYTPQSLGSQAGRDAVGTQVACLLVSSAVLNALGYPDQALIRLHEGLRLARELAHPFTLATALSSAAHHHRRRRELQPAHEMTEALMALAGEQGFPMWIARATVLRGWIRAMQGEAEEGVSLVDQVLNSQRHLIEETGHPIILEMAAQVYGAAGRADEGLRWLAEAQAIVKKSGARYTEAEVYHQMGRLLLAHSSKNHAEAEAHLRRAVAIARSQQAKAAELRATTTLSRLWQQQGKQAEGRQLLTKIYDRFTEGFDIPDLKEARALLDTLR